MRNILIAAFAFGAIVAGGTVARADDFGGQRHVANSPTAYTEYGSQDQNHESFGAYLDNQASSAQLSDPTAPNSIRSHGNH